MPLPIGMFRWLSDDEIADFKVDSISSNSKHGYTVMCDLHYPDHLHSKHNEFPLAPEQSINL